MSGHRVVSAAPGFTIRAPWALFECEAGTGIDAVGNVADLSNFGVAAGKLGDGTPGLQNSGTNNFLFIVDSEQDSSFGFWYELKAEDISEGGQSVLAGLTIDELFGGSNKILNFLVRFVDNVLTLQIAAADVSYKDTSLGSLAAGWHHFAFSKTGDTLQFYLNGVAVGTSSALAVPAVGEGSGVELIGINNGYGSIDQPVFAQVAYTAEEWAYIYNSGAGRLYADWSITP